MVNDLKFLAKSNGKKGYAINLKEALILPFLKFSDNRKLRKKVLKSWKSRGLKSGNSEIIKKTINGYLHFQLILHSLKKNI